MIWLTQPEFFNVDELMEIYQIQTHFMDLQGIGNCIKAKYRQLRIGVQSGKIACVFYTG